MINSKSIEVFYQGLKVGTLAMTPSKLVAFEYSEEWLRAGVSISPFSLPLEKGCLCQKKMI